MAGSNFFKAYYKRALKQKVSNHFGIATQATNTMQFFVFFAIIMASMASASYVANSTEVAIICGISCDTGKPYAAYIKDKNEACPLSGSPMKRADPKAEAKPEAEAEAESEAEAENEESGESKYKKCTEVRFRA